MRLEEEHDGKTSVGGTKWNGKGEKIAGWNDQDPVKISDLARFTSYLSGLANAVRVGYIPCTLSKCLQNVLRGSTLGPIPLSISVSSTGHIVLNTSGHQQYVDNTQFQTCV